MGRMSSGMTMMALNNKDQSIGDIITARRNRALDRQGYIGLLLRVLGLVLVGWVLFTQVFLITQASGNEMFPAIKDGDLVIAFRLHSSFSKDDVVVYTADGKERVGRVAAIAGDQVMLDDSGSLLVNGTVQSGEILYPTYAKDGEEYPYQVPDRCVFILGDFRTQAEDSRDYGAIPLREVKGKVITILRRRGL